MTCSPISTDFEIVDTLVDVSKPPSCHCDLIINTVIIPIDKKLFCPFPRASRLYSPPSIYALSPLRCPKELPVIPWAIMQFGNTIYLFHIKMFPVFIHKSYQLTSRLFFGGIYYLLNTLSSGLHSSHASHIVATIEQMVELTL